MLVHRTGLLSKLDRECLLSCLATNTVTDAVREEQHAEEAKALVVRMRGARMLATQQDIDDALLEERPPHLPPDLPHCQAKDLRVPKSYEQAVRSEHGRLWKDSIAREWRGLLEAGTCETAE